jgi:hypothetical protein
MYLEIYDMSGSPINLDREDLLIIISSVREHFSIFSSQCISDEDLFSDFYSSYISNFEFDGYIESVASKMVSSFENTGYDRLRAQRKTADFFAVLDKLYQRDAALINSVQVSQINHLSGPMNC